MAVLWIAAIGGGYLVFLAIMLFVVRPKANERRLQVVVNNAGLPLTSEIEPMAGLLVWAIGWASRKPQQRYLRRLWPEFIPAPLVAKPSKEPTA